MHILLVNDDGITPRASARCAKRASAGAAIG